MAHIFVTLSTRKIAFCRAVADFGYIPLHRFCDVMISTPSPLDCFIIYRSIESKSRPTPRAKCNANAEPSKARADLQVRRMSLSFMPSQLQLLTTELEASQASHDGTWYDAAAAPAAIIATLKTFIFRRLCWLGDCVNRRGDRVRAASGHFGCGFGCSASMCVSEAGNDEFDDFLA